VSPLKTICSWNPVGSDTAAAGVGVVSTASDVANKVMATSPRARARPTRLNELRPILIITLRCPPYVRYYCGREGQPFFSIP
jgi:hypothetical protein